MKFKSTLGLLLLVLALGAYIWRFERQPARTRTAQLPPHWRINPAAVTTLQFDGGTQFWAVCTSEDGQWRLTQPTRAPADSAQLDGLLNALATLTPVEAITPAEQRAHRTTLADYGLAQPRLRLTLGDSTGRRTLLVGRHAPLGATVYVKDADQPLIFSVDAGLLERLPAGVQALRDRVLFHGNPEEAQRLEVRNGAEYLQLVRSERQGWQLQQPVPGRVDRRVLQPFLNNLFDLRVESFVADGVRAFSTYGLDETAARVNVWTAGCEGMQSVIFGNPVAGTNGQVYARLEGGDSVFAVRQEFLEILRVRALHLRDRRLLPLNPAEIVAVRLSEGERSVELQRRPGEGWRLRSPQPGLADSARVEELLKAWAEARIESFGLTTPTNPPPHPRTVLFSRRPFDAPALPPQGETPEPPLSVQLLPEPVGGGRLAVQVANEPAVYHVTERLSALHAVDPLYYRDRTILQLAPAEVVRLDVQAAGATQSWTRAADGQPWQPTAPTTSPVPADALAEALTALTHLTAQCYVAENPPDLAVYGLATPRLSCRLGLQSATSLGKELLLGAATPEGGAYALLRGHDVVFQLDPATCRKLERLTPRPPPSPVLK